MIIFRKAFKAIILFLLGFGPCLSAQDMPQTVIGSNGSYYQNALFGNLHFTVGEVAVAYYNPSLELGEGFHHSYYDLIVDTKEIIPSQWDVQVYPNPTAERIHINMPDETFTHLQLFNNLGQSVYEKEMSSLSMDIDMSNFPSGTFLLRLQDISGRQVAVQIQKISR